MFQVLEWLTVVGEGLNVPKTEFISQWKISEIPSRDYRNLRSIIWNFPSLVKFLKGLARARVAREKITIKTRFGIKSREIFMVRSFQWTYQRNGKHKKFCRHQLERGEKTKTSQKGSQNYAIDPYLRRNSTWKPLTFSQFPLFGKERSARGREEVMKFKCEGVFGNHKDYLIASKVGKESRKLRWEMREVGEVLGWLWEILWNFQLKVILNSAVFWCSLWSF